MRGMKIYCSGIGGIGLSAYAAFQAASGHTVLGSDRSDSPLLQDLRSQGIAVFLNQDGSCVPPDADLFVFSEAVPADAPERERARAFNLPARSYFHALGELSQGFTVIAVCGTHGKSSTTAMAARVLMECGKDPSVIVGTKMRELDGRNWRRGKSDLFVVEACEYRRSFHYLSPSIALMTTVDGDHFDAYGSLEEYQDAFVTFLKRLPQKGTVITHGGDPDCLRIARECGRSIVDADAIGPVMVEVKGEHMRQNARLVVALGDYLGMERQIVLESLKGFRGTWRRMEEKGTMDDGITVVDDYAHHPAEIRATLQAMREAYPGRRVICVFQPHTHDRTIKLYEDFAQAFSDAALVVIPNVYEARREAETETVDLPAFIRDIAAGSSTVCLDGNGLQGTVSLLREKLKPGDVLVTMGAGDVTKLGDMMMKK